MKIRTIRLSLIGFAAVPLLSGCASIISGRQAQVAIDSYPSNAHVVVHDNDGREVASLNTPGVVTLKRNRRYFLPARYTATIEAPGYAPSVVPIRSTVNPWILGNVVIGGIPGLVVDNATGAAWRPRHSEIHTELTPFGTPGQGMLYSSDQQPPPASAEAPPQVAQRSPQTISAQGNQQQPAGPAGRY